MHSAPPKAVCRAVISPRKARKNFFTCSFQRSGSALVASLRILDTFPDAKKIDQVTTMCAAVSFLLFIVDGSGLATTVNLADSRLNTALSNYTYIQLYISYIPHGHSCLPIGSANTPSPLPVHPLNSTTDYNILTVNIKNLH